MKSKFIASTIAMVLVLSSLLGLYAYADWSYGETYTDNVTTTDTQELGRHPHSQRDIGASYIYVTAPTNQSYVLYLYTRTWGLYYQEGGPVLCQTAGLGGYYYWENANPDMISAKYAYIEVIKTSSGNTSLGGYIRSTSRTWR